MRLLELVAVYAFGARGRLCPDSTSRCPDLTNTPGLEPLGRASATSTRSAWPSSDPEDGDAAPALLAFLLAAVGAGRRTPPPPPETLPELRTHEVAPPPAMRQSVPPAAPRSFDEDGPKAHGQ